METPDSNERLSALLDNELSDAERRALEKELESDSALRAEFEALRGAREMVRAHGRSYAPADFVEKVMSKVENEVIPANNSNFWRRPFGVPIEAVAVAAAALMVVFGSLGTGVVLVGGQQAVEAVMDAEAPSEPAPMATSPEERGAEPPELEVLAADPQVQAEKSSNADKKVSFSEPMKDEIASTGSGLAIPAAPANAPGDRLEDETKEVQLLSPATETVKSDPAPPPDTSRAYEERDDVIPEATKPSKTKSPPEPKSAPRASADHTESAPASAGSKNSWPESQWTYRLVTTNAAILGDLNGIAKKSGGVLRDSALNVVQGGSVQAGDTGTYYIEVDAKRLKDLDRSLKAFGATVNTSGSTESGNVLVRISILVILQQK